MPPLVATIAFSIGILGLFCLDRHEGPPLSKALWLPFGWLFLISSRSVSFWFGIPPNFNGIDATEAYVEGSPIDRAVFTLLLLAALAVLVARMNRVAPLLRKNKLVISFFLFCAISISWSDFPFVAFKRWTKAVGDLGMVLLILTESHPLGALKSLVSRLGFVIFPLSILFIKYYPQLGRRLTNSWTMEPVGVATQKNSLGLICLVYGTAFLWMFWSVYRKRDDPSQRRRLLAYGTIIGMIIWLLIQCNSTTSIVALASTTGLMWLAARRSRKPALVHVLVLGVLALSATAMFFDPGGSLVGMLGKNPTLTGRTQIWNLVLGMHTNPWIGTGFESFWLGPRLELMRNALPNFPINEAHNGYVEVYLNCGWVGICFIASLVATAYNRVMSRFHQDPQTASLFLAFLLCTLFNAFTENAFRLMTPSWIFLLLVIMAASQAELFRNVPLRGPVQSPRDRADQRAAYAALNASPVH